MKFNLYYVLIFLASVNLNAQQVNVSMDFTNLTFPRTLKTYVPDHIWPLNPLLSYDNVHFKHRVNTDAFGNCVVKSLFASFILNTDGITGGMATGTATSSTFNRNYNYWVDDNVGNYCDMDGDRCGAYLFGNCLWQIQDDRRTDGNEPIDLSGWASGTWNNHTPLVLASR